MNILMNILGVLIYFLNRFNNRRQKDKTFSLSFWINNNWVELLVILLVDISVMILLLTNDITLEMADFMPSMLGKIGDLTISWMIGLGLASLIYNTIKAKITPKDRNDG